MSRAKKAKPSFQKRLSRTGFEQIPRAPNRFQMHRVFRIGLDFLTQAANVNVHAARRDESVRSPDRIEQLISSKDAVWARSKVIEQPEFERAKRYGFPGMADAIGRRINRQLADLNGARRIGGRLGTADRKSTRLNSSHDQISYAVFCLKKKKKRQANAFDPTCLYQFCGAFREPTTPNRPQPYARRAALAHHLIPDRARWLSPRANAQAGRRSC